MAYKVLHTNWFYKFVDSFFFILININSPKNMLTSCDSNTTLGNIVDNRLMHMKKR